MAVMFLIFVSSDGGCHYTLEEMGELPGSPQRAGSVSISIHTKGWPKT